MIKRRIKGSAKAGGVGNDEEITNREQAEEDVVIAGCIVPDEAEEIGELREDEEGTEESWGEEELDPEMVQEGRGEEVEFMKENWTCSNSALWRKR